ncbi:MAG: N(4)-(beta-N-acetylglucosaminyl)-L-asparaginase [Anaerolineae bacterium]|nr:N(4)-(beta-N-acetylglucosaminyl)-L-asparaginase [Anaerolineae bacterium]
MNTAGIVVGSFNARVGLPAAIAILRAGGSALDAAVAAVREVEDDLSDRGVGTGGLPNILGQVELDASLMDGQTLASGAVGALKGYPHPIDVARKVMELTPHVMLVGDGADLFARLHGFEPAPLLTSDVEEYWRQTITASRVEDMTLYDRRGERYAGVVRDWTTLLHQEIFGTTNVIARDGQGNIACAVSTSGWGFKWPGRLGDSPIIGAGNYADNRYGAAACTGRGELAIRVALAYNVVRSLREGRPLDHALRAGLGEVNALPDNLEKRAGSMNIVAMGRDGQVAAASNVPDSHYVYQTTDMDTLEVRPRLYVPDAL